MNRVVLPEVNAAALTTSSTCSDTSFQPHFMPADYLQPCTPLENQPCTPLENQPCTPLENQPCTPLENQPCTPLENQPCTPLENQPCTPPENQPCTPLENQPSVNLSNVATNSFVLYSGSHLENMSSYSNVHNNRTVAVVLFGTSATLDKNSVAGFCEDKSVDHNSSSGSTTKCATVAAVRPTNILPPGTSTDLHGEDCFGNQSAVIEKRGRKKQDIHYRSVGTQHKVKFRDTKVSPIKLYAVDAACSPIKKQKLNTYDVFGSDTSLSSESDTNSCSSESEFSPNTLSECEESDMEAESEEKKEISLSALKVTRYQNKKDSLHYLGILKECLFLLNILEANISFKGRLLMTSDVVTLVLRKIRRGFTFKTLGDMYGISESYADRIYNMYLPVLSESLQCFVKMLPSDSVQRNLPMAFWARNSNVYIIIDGFEIEIQSPGNPYDQADTFSSYKKCNTVKYLIGISPDGTIMFISNGFVGRDSDNEITIVSNFVSKLPKGRAVMADRGFKNLETLLQQAGCHLIRPPSVKEGEILSPDLAKEAKKIASLRSHVERSIGRIREFRLLNIHSAIPGSLLNVVDHAVNVACGLVNCQQPLLKV